MIQTGPCECNGHGHIFSASAYCQWCHKSKLFLEHQWMQQEIKRLQARERSDDEQFCKIATFLGKDARQAPKSDQSIAGLVIAEIKQLQAIIAAKLHLRRCHDCGHEFYAADGMIPFCLCEKCKSQDTRRRMK